MSDQINFEDNEYVWPVGDMPGVPAEQLVPPAPPITVDLGKMWDDRKRLQMLVGCPTAGSLLGRAADEIERLRRQVADLVDILDIAMNTADKTL